MVFQGFFLNMNFYFKAYTLKEIQDEAYRKKLIGNKDWHSELRISDGCNIITLYICYVAMYCIAGKLGGNNVWW